MNKILFYLSILFGILSLLVCIIALVGRLTSLFLLVGMTCSLAGSIISLSDLFILYRQNQSIRWNHRSVFTLMLNSTPVWMIMIIIFSTKK